MMKRTDIQKLVSLQRNPANIRNVCILAHVDHGKTTLADALLASNGIISQRLAGKLRYLDSREDEQLRGITMKSSAISLYYNQNANEYLVNLIDSPGHIDFSSEVSTAVRLCDGAVILVDVIEGVCPQTHAVLRQAWLENIRPVLVLNKIDRLITEWKMTPSEAYIHLQRTLEQVNAVTGELFTSDVFAKSSENNLSSAAETQTTSDQLLKWSSGLEDSDDSQLYFCPDQGNVVFASAADGWGFRVEQFAQLYAKKVGVSATVLQQTLWGDFCLDSKTKTVKKGAQAKNKKTLFVQLILDNIWTVYDAVLVSRDKEMIAKIVRSLDLKSPPVVTDARTHLQSLFNQWLPLSQAVLAMVCDLLPSPLEMSSDRAEKMLQTRHRSFAMMPAATQQLKHDFLACSSQEEAPVIIFISKMFPIDVKSLPQNRTRPLTAEEISQRRQALKQRLAEKKERISGDADNAADTLSNDMKPLPVKDAAVTDEQMEEDQQVFIAFARVYSGVVRRGQNLYVLGPKHDPCKVIDSKSSLDVEQYVSPGDLEHVCSIQINDVYMFMGRELEALDDIPAGNILGIGGLEDCVLKSAALSSTIACPAFTDLHHEATPIVRVAIEPRNMSDMDALIHGMKLLNQSDPCIEVLVQETGEHVIVAAGEVHLQKCLDDLRLRFSKIDIDVSSPIVPFRETIIPPPTTDRVNELIESDIGRQQGDNCQPQCKTVVMTTASQQCTVHIRAVPLPSDVVRSLVQHSHLIKTANRLSSAATSADKSDVLRALSDQVATELQQFRQKLDADFAAAPTDDVWSTAVDRIWSFSRNGTNILLNGVEGYDRPTLWAALDGVCRSAGNLREYDSAVVSGFQMATQYGPLCEEPMMGVCFIVEKWVITEMSQLTDSNLPPVSDETNVSAAADLMTSDSLTETLADGPETADDDADELPSSDRQRADAGRRYQLSGQLISCVKEGCRKAFQLHPQRLMWPMYTCVIQATTDVLGKMYAVIGRRSGRVVSDELREGSSIFNVTAVMPVVESFGFADEIRKRTSGLASPQLHFSHWEVIDIDPFWVPTTEEEYLHFGEKADSENVARKHVNAVRRRKGLHVNEKIVEFAEKQRTLKKNK